MDVKYVPGKPDKQVYFCNAVFGFYCHRTKRSSA